MKRKFKESTFFGLSPRLARAAKIALRLLLVAALVPLAVIFLLRFIDPPGSMVMVARKLDGVAVRYKWVPLEKISPVLVKTVVTSEDAAFCRHRGVDWEAIDHAITQAKKNGEGPRGASTIPMQTARNLFLWQQRSYIRKAMEIPLAYAMSALWPKRRMIEVYLNIAEWGPGIFGAETAARKHFNRSAAGITARQAAQMAASLPNPHVRNAGRPGPKTRRLSVHIARRVKNEDILLDCIYGK